MSSLILTGPTPYKLPNFFCNENRGSFKAFSTAIILPVSISSFILAFILSPIPFIFLRSSILFIEPGNNSIESITLLYALALNGSLLSFS